MYKIEKNIPIQGYRRGAPPTYPFHDMEVGDSFEADEAKIKLIRSAASTFGKRHGKALSVIKIGNDRIRIWRVS